VLPVLVLGALLVVQVARVAADHLAVHHALREAARRAAVEPDRGAVTAAAVGAAPGLDPTRLTVELGPERARGDLVSVRVGYRSPTGVPVVGRLVGDIDLAATAVVRIE
jgi:hypothetical protein